MDFVYRLMADSCMFETMMRMNKGSMSSSPATYFNHRSGTFKKNKRRGL